MSDDELTGQIASEIPECLRCGRRWLDTDEHWRWVLLHATDDPELTVELLVEGLDPTEPLLAWCCPMCSPPGFG